MSGKRFSTLLVSLLLSHASFAIDDSDAGLQTVMLESGPSTVSLKMPASLEIEFLTAVPAARLFTFDQNAAILLGTKSSTIYRVPFPYRDKQVLAKIPNASIVHSVALRDGYLYAADSCALYRARYDGNLQSGFDRFLQLPCQTGGHHTRTVITGPDNRLYISIGISGNCSDEFLDNSYPFEKRRGGIFVVDESSGRPKLEPYASGLRNPIGMAFSDNSLYATNAGSDNLGYELPPEVLVRTEAGSFHGMPWYQYFNNDFQDGRCASSSSPVDVTRAKIPVALFDARSTPMGIDFPAGNVLDGLFKNSAVIAVHGSWGKPPGGGPESRRPPKLMSVDFAGKDAVSVKDLVSGFQRDDGSRFARPVDIKSGPDGNLYFSSDGGEVEGLFRLRLK